LSMPYVHLHAAWLVHTAYPCPCGMSFTRSMLHVNAHSACPYLFCMTVSMLGVLYCTCPCCISTYLTMLHFHVHVYSECPCQRYITCPCLC
jgi:hypothetical protein